MVAVVDFDQSFDRGDAEVDVEVVVAVIVAVVVYDLFELDVDQSVAVEVLFYSDRNF